MTKTQNYQLPQWVKSDRIMMDDFNEAMSNIEKGLTAAKSKADSAESKADAAYKPGNLPYKVGSYRGNGGEVTVALGFRPSFVIICGSTSVYPTSTSLLGEFELFSAGNALSDCITFTDTGFVIPKLADNVYPKLAEERTYDYIAFR